MGKKIVMCKRDVAWLKKHEPCKEAYVWATRNCRNLAQAWEKCQNETWMCWAYMRAKARRFPSNACCVCFYHADEARKRFKNPFTDKRYLTLEWPYV